MGELPVRGPSISPGDWPLGDADRHPPEQWLGTGDLGYVSPDGSGELVVCGRAKDATDRVGRSGWPVLAAVSP